MSTKLRLVILTAGMIASFSASSKADDWWKISKHDFYDAGVPKINVKRSIREITQNAFAEDVSQLTPPGLKFPQGCDRRSAGRFLRA